MWLNDTSAEQSSQKAAPLTKPYHLNLTLQKNARIGHDSEMMIVEQATAQLSALADKVSVEVFVFLGSLIEEVIAPIPSPVVMTLAGTIAHAQEKPALFLLLLAAIGATGKTIGSYLLYVLADKLEDAVLGKFGRFFGLSHAEVEKFGQHFKGNFKDEILIFLTRAIPIVPTAPVSILCGAIKIPLKSYLIAGFFGLLIRNLFYLYLGYVGLASYQSIIGQLDSVESVMTITLALATIGAFAAIWYAKNKDRMVDALHHKAVRHTSEKK